MANDDRVITVARLKDFLARLIGNSDQDIQPTVYTVGAANATFAKKNGDPSVEFSTKALSVCDSDSNSYKLWIITKLGNKYLRIIGDNNANILADIPLNNGEAITTTVFNPTLKANCNVVNNARFLSDSPVGVFYRLNQNDLSNLEVIQGGYRMSCQGQIESTEVVYIQAVVDGVSLNGFYYASNHSDGAWDFELIGIPPARRSLYYDRCNSILCYYTGSSFQTISTGSGGGGGEDYEYATYDDISDLFN